jgi:hypothetical protein
MEFSAFLDVHPSRRDVVDAIARTPSAWTPERYFSARAHDDTPTIERTLQ